MDVEFSDEDLDHLETDAKVSLGHGQQVVKGYRKVLQAVRAARDERDLYAMKSLRFEKLQGARAGQRSLRINKQWRLIVEVDESTNPHTIKVVQIEDYH